MKRREALKNLGLAAGFVVATPSVISLLQSCTSDAKTWTPVFLSVEEGVVLTNLVDTILPKSESLPAATEINVPEFIDKYFSEVLEVEQQNQVKSGFASIITILKPNPEESIDKVKPENYMALLDNHMRIKGEIDEEREANPESEAMTKSEFLNNMKWMTIKAYKTTQEIGENVLNYDPVPGAYYCGDLQELTGGKSYSL
ncbi:gluconate 2-dehydrogenase subunit 3 family protein [Geojedonia litorea]|uniref:Gluconate 2-dehydrogenase subunit 3 family protein n=1 Tax=Geojedonia litorea TaxID=1268269 RepID=A0ABV9N2B8_9FLAO